jgi:polyphosphate kinase
MNFSWCGVSGLIEQAEAGIHPHTPDGLSPTSQLKAIRQCLLEKVALQHQTFEQDLVPQLREHSVYLLDYADLTQEQKFYLKDYFEHRIYPVLTPLSVDPAHPFPRMSNLSLNLAVRVVNPENGNERFAGSRCQGACRALSPCPINSGPTRGRAAFGWGCLWSR